MSNALERIAENTRIRRKLFDLSQEMLAEKTGLSLSLIRRIERKTANPTLSSLEKIATVLEIDVIDLFQNLGPVVEEEQNKNLIILELSHLTADQLMHILELVRSLKK